MPLERRKWITREMLQAEPDTLFVFGDNLTRVGMGGQAKEMRGEPNAVGLPTKRLPTNDPLGFLTDADLKEVQFASNDDVGRLIMAVMQGKTVVWPEDGIGTGLAGLQEHAPLIAASYDSVLRTLEKLAKIVATQDYEKISRVYELIAQHTERETVQ